MHCVRTNMHHESPASNVAAEWNKHHAALYSCFMTMQASRVIVWNVSGGRTSFGCKENHACSPRQGPVGPLLEPDVKSAQLEDDERVSLSHLLVALTIDSLPTSHASLTQPSARCPQQQPPERGASAWTETSKRKSWPDQVRNEARVTSLCLPPRPVTHGSAHGDTQA